MTDPSIEQRIIKLEKATQRLRWVCASQVSVILAIWISATLTYRVNAQNSPQILRVRGLVIEDNQGRARVILGAPLPAVRERKRQGSLTDSMVFLDEEGHDRLTLGEGPNPQAQGKILHRIATFFGILIHDNNGNERGGYGWLSNGRAVITLDRPGLDAWAAVVDDQTGFAGMRVEYAPDVARDKTGIEIGTQDSRALFRLMDTKERNRAVLRLGDDGVSSFQAFDEEGRSTRNLLQSESTR
jgi:hypothetical protein